MYTILDHGEMIADRARTDAFAEALRRAVTPGAVVVDIGTGTGILALLACSFGARRVYAIEVDDIIEVARELARDNGCADRIEFIQGPSTAITLPERADIIVSDLYGLLPLFRHSVWALIDARRRFLAPHGRLIPRRAILWATPIEAPALYLTHAEPWDERPFGFDMQAARRMAANVWRQGQVESEQFLSEPRACLSIDYLTIDNPNVQAEETWPVTRHGTGHGLAVWFEKVVADDVRITSAPGVPTRAYGTVFFPWAEAVALEAGDTVLVAFQANLVGDRYIWRWRTRVAGNGDRTKAVFTQSDAFGRALSPTRLLKHTADYVPTLSEDGEIVRLILDGLRTHQPLGAVASDLRTRFPHRFARWHDALARVGALAERYSW